MALISKRPQSVLSWKQGKWGPTGSFPYRVRYGENWWKIAAKDGWSDVWAFIEFNFRTRNAAEVNWYLDKFVGCTLIAPDGKNLCFSDNLSPGIIYTKHQLQPNLPPPTYPIPMPTPIGGDENGPGEVQPNGCWVGLGVKVGGMLGPIGYDGVNCTLLASNKPEYQAHTLITTYREGWGGGISGGPVLVVVTGVRTVAQMNAMTLKNPDWNLALGIKLGAVGKLAAKMPRLAAILYASARGIEFGADKADTVINSLKSLAAAASLEFTSNVPSCAVVDIPVLGGGVEVSTYTGYSKFRVYRVRERWQDDVLIKL